MFRPPAGLSGYWWHQQVGKMPLLILHTDSDFFFFFKAITDCLPVLLTLGVLCASGNFIGLLITAWDWKFAECCVLSALRSWLFVCLFVCLSLVSQHSSGGRCFFCFFCLWLFLVRLKMFTPICWTSTDYSDFTNVQLFNVLFSYLLNARFYFFYEIQKK